VLTYDADRVSIAWRACAVMLSQFPALISGTGQSHDPPTATTLRSDSHSAALEALMPPVGQKRACGNGPPNARNADIPPACCAGKNFTISKPCASAAINSDAVAIPGTKGIWLREAAWSSSGVAPGLRANFASIDAARSRSAPFSTVPNPTIASGTSAMIALAASSATDVRSVISRTRIRARQRHGVLNAIDGDHRDYSGRAENVGKRLLPGGRRRMIGHELSHQLVQLRVALSGMADRGMIAPG
jgi:hypothetical protein